jgi:hypothetical protein
MKILVAIDFSPVTENVLATIERMAGTFPVEVWLVHVSPPDPAFVGYETGPDVVRSQVATEHRQRHQQLHQLADRLRAHQVGATALLLQGPTVETIVADTKRLGADGSRRRVFGCAMSLTRSPSMSSRHSTNSGTHSSRTGVWCSRSVPTSNSCRFSRLRTWPSSNSRSVATRTGSIFAIS